MAQTFFFYDLETSGLSPRDDRIMQFAGQRTDLDLNPLGEPINMLVALAEDTLPSPGALLTTKITPLQTKLDGATEKEFCDYAMAEIFTPNTIAVGYNSVHFDDEFIRFTFWRNFYDPYEWQWKDGRSRWDMIDVVRMTRALRPEGINWPTEVVPAKDEDGNEIPGETVKIPSNRLEKLSVENGIKHEHAHDALSDVFALIGITKLIKEKQPQLYNYLFELRDKKRVAGLVNLEKPQPFVYTSGSLEGKNLKTSVFYPIAKGRGDSVIAIDLRYDPAEAKLRQVAPNKCPAVAPIGVLEAKTRVGADGEGKKSGDGAKKSDDKAEKTGWDNINLDLKTVKENLAKLNSALPEIRKKLKENSVKTFEPAPDPESALYDAFLQDGDRALCATVRAADKTKLQGATFDFDDKRLKPLFEHFKARNYPEILTGEELKDWEKYRLARLNRQAPVFLEEMQKIQATGKASNGRDADPEIVQALSDWYQNLQSVDYD